MKTTEPIAEPTEPIFKPVFEPDLKPVAVTAGAPAAPRDRTPDAALEPHWLDAIDAATD